RYWGEFGGLRVYMVDEYDIFVSKLSSKQAKHKQDLEVLAGKLDKELAKRRLLEHGHYFLTNEFLRAQIEENWRFIYREPLVFEEAKPEHPPPATPAAAPKKKRKKK